MERILHKIREFVWGWPLLFLFLGVGLIYTVCLRVIQLRYLPTALRSIFKTDEGNGTSPFAALCTALASTIGTGNIVGVATALAIGGPGALLWMLLAAFLGMATQYAECFLASKYRRSDGFGGPFVYIERALGKKKLAKVYAFIGALAGILGVGTVTQVNSITSAVDGFFESATAFGTFSWATVLSGAIVGIASALVLLGGADRISKVCQTLVPLMSAIYISACLLLLIGFADKIPSAITLVVKSAFFPDAALGALCGISLKSVVRMGVGRGVFTNEAGLGTSAIAAAESQSKDPVRQGLVSMTGTFIDTIVICTMTGLCLIVTDAWSMPLEGVQITDFAWRIGLPCAERFSSFLLMLCLIFFAFATIIGWNFYAERCLQYLSGTRFTSLYRCFYLLAIFIAPYYSVQAAWEAADILNALLALPNLYALLMLRPIVLQETQHRLKKLRQTIH